jgi:hypothetical protein
MLNLKDRPTLQKVLAAFVTSVLMLVGILLAGGDEEKDRKVVSELCGRGLEQLAVAGGLDLCTHGPDPVRTFKAPVGEAITAPSYYYRQDRLCPGDGKSGDRVYIYVGSPSDKPAPTTTFIKLVKQSLGLAERQLRESHPTHAQKIQFYCAADKTPTITTLTYPAVGIDDQFDFDDMLQAFDNREVKPGAHISFVYGIDGNYPYCGEGTVGGGEWDPGTNYALIAPFCVSPSDTFTHELGHNLGAVDIDAPNDSGGWHCFDINDLMCYNDGGTYFTSGGQMVTRCNRLSVKTSLGTTTTVERFDCNNDDYYNPASALSWIDVSDSPYLTSPRRK